MPPDKALPLVLVNDDGIRPAGPSDECFYCRQKVGTSHLFDCVILHKIVRVKYIYEVEIEVPFSWDEETIRFCRNDGSWCADNGIRDLEENAQYECLCTRFQCIVGETTNPGPIRYTEEEVEERNRALSTDQPR